MVFEFSTARIGQSRRKRQAENTGVRGWTVPRAALGGVAVLVLTGLGTAPAVAATAVPIGVSAPATEDCTVRGGSDLSCTGATVDVGSTSTKTLVCTDKCTYVTRYFENSARFKFDLSAIPAGAVITAAKLRPFVVTAPGNSPVYVRVRPLQAAGGSPGAEISTGTIGAANQYAAIDVRDLVREWVAGTRVNHGLLLDRNTGGEPPSSVNYAGLGASENTSLPRRPTLEITYQREARSGERSYDSYRDFPLSRDETLRVNPADGNLLLQAADATISGGLGPGVSIGRSYNSAADARGIHGAHWSASYGPDVKLSIGADDLITNQSSSGDLLSWTRTTQPPAWMRATSAIGTSNATTGYSNSTLTDNASQGVQTFRGFDGKLESFKDRNGRGVTYGYDASGQLTTISYSGNRKLYATFSGGRLTELAEPQDATQPISSTNPVLRRWSYGYTAGVLSSYTDPEGGVRTYTYNADGRLSEVRDARLNKTYITYTPGGKVATVKRQTGVDTSGNPTGPTTTFAYPLSTQTDVTDPENHTSHYTFGSDGQVTEIRDPLNRTTRNSFTSDLFGKSYTRPSAGTGSTPTLEFTRDAANGNIMMARTQFGSGASDYYDSTVGYGPSGVAGGAYKPRCALNAQGQRTRFGYASDGNPISQTVINPPAGGGTAGCDAGSGETVAASVTNEYDPASPGKLTGVLDARGNRTTFAYNANGDLTSIAPPVLAPTQIAYDSSSRIDTVTNARGEIIDYSYDKLDRLTRLQYADGTAVTYNYDANSNLVGSVDPLGTTSYTYDALNRLTHQQQPGGRATDYTYDQAGNLASLTDASGVTNYTYNAANQPDRVREPGDPANAGTSYTYETASGKPDLLNLPNGIVVDRDFDDADRMTHTKAVRTATSGLVDERTYSYVTGSKNQELLGSETVAATAQHAATINTYTYDALDRLTEGAPDAAGNVLPKSSGACTPAGNFNAFNQLSSITSGTSTTLAATYDGNGNQTAVSAPASVSGCASEQLTATFNKRDQMTQLNGVAATYFGAGQADLASYGGTTLESNSLGLSRITDGAGTTYITRGDGSDPIGQRTPNGRQYYVTDRLGSVVALTDSGGATIASYTYGPYGEGSLGTGYNQTYLGWTGGYVTGSLYHFGQRFYDATQRRWTQPDPLDQTGDLLEGNRYAYAGGDPVNSIDPAGTVSCSTFGVGGICNAAEKFVGGAGKIALSGLKKCGLGALGGSLGVAGGVVAVNVTKAGAGTALVRAAGGPYAYVSFAAAGCISNQF